MCRNRRMLGEAVLVYCILGRRYNPLVLVQNEPLFCAYEKRYDVVEELTYLVISPEYSGLVIIYRVNAHYINIRAIFLQVMVKP